MHIVFKMASISNRRFLRETRQHSMECQLSIGRVRDRSTHHTLPLRSTCAILAVFVSLFGDSGRSMGNIIKLRWMQFACAILNVLSIGLTETYAGGSKVNTKLQKIYLTLFENKN